jgi:alpha-tubulin suppressor-like RCC1 family protein
MRWAGWVLTSLLLTSAAACASLAGLSTGHDAGSGSDAASDAPAPDSSDSASSDSAIFDAVPPDADANVISDAGCDGPVPDPTALSDAIHIALGNGFACAVRTGGTVVCWGQFYRGQLGFIPEGGVGVQGADYVTTPTAVAGLSGITSIAAGDSHACAIDEASHVYCWGYNSDGQLGNRQVSVSKGTNYVGNGMQVIDWNPQPAIVQSKTGGMLERAVAVACGLDHSCVFVQGGVAACWGNNDHGQLGEPGGSGMFETAAVPSSISLGGAVSVSAGLSCSCAVVQGTPSTVQCTGSNASGQIGGTPPDSGVVVTMPLPPNAQTPQAVTSSFYNSPHTVVLDTGGKAFGAGDNSGGALGAFSSTQPAAIPGLSNGNVVQVATSPSHTCAMLADGTLQCIGENNWGELGRGFTSVGMTQNNPDYVETPAAAGAPDLDASDGTHLTGVAEVAIGLEVSCAIVRNACRTDGTVYCWGANFVGQLGNGTQSPSKPHDRPTAVHAP